ncbi:MAG: hypothetical protein EP305_03320 [Bacteroidetes bacterium]|nr:MAG: hypothetical protein EP305_03320 [Bacteroidota bacterium]
MKTSWIVNWCILFFAFNLYGQWPVHIEEIQHSYAPGKDQVQFLSSPKNTYTSPEQIKDKPFKTLPGNTPNFGFSTNDVWFRLHLIQKSENTKTIHLVFDNPNLDQADVFLVNGDQQTTKFNFSDQKPFRDRPFNSRKAVFPLELSKGNYFVYFKVNNGGEQFHFGIKIEKPEVTQLNERHESFYFGIFFGLILFMLLINVYMYVINKEQTSLYYSFYILFLLGLHFSLLGFGKQYIWNDSHYWSNHANPVFASLSVLFLIIFSRRYLRTDQLLVRWDQILKVAGYTVLVIAVITFIPTDFTYRLSVVGINAVTLLLNLVILPVAMLSWKEGNRDARLYFIAFTLLVSGVFLFILKNFGILPAEGIFNYMFQIGSAAEVMILSMGIILRYRNAQQDSIKRLEELNAYREQVNQELELKVEERTQELKQKNIEITSSIQYAKRIQEAIVPDQHKLERILPGAKVLYHPKDIVSGDFYWVNRKVLAGHPVICFAVADCTGHGVPGAMMSVLCHSILERTLEEMTHAEPGQFLERTNQLLIEELSRNNAEIKDGMDISLGMIFEQSGNVLWSGANRPIFICRNGEINEIQGTKRAIGQQEHLHHFQTHHLDVGSQDSILLFSDGITDQFGGELGKKVSKKRLIEWISVCKELSPEQLIHFLDQRFESWKGENEQTDDVCLMLVPLGQLINTH